MYIKPRDSSMRKRSQVKSQHSETREEGRPGRIRQLMPAERKVKVRAAGLASGKARKKKAGK
jgi:hypothetical protein